MKCIFCIFCILTVIAIKVNSQKVKKTKFPLLREKIEGKAVGVGFWNVIRGE